MAPERSVAGSTVNPSRAQSDDPAIATHRRIRGRGPASVASDIPARYMSPWPGGTNVGRFSSLYV